jgi:glycerol-3-phosphate dehydrogenase
MMNGVLIVGAGIVGAGIARDLALRGLPVTVLERGAPAAGATGRCHGLLHSGARYAVKDPAAAAECALENPVLKEIAPHYVEDTSGLFVAVSDEEAAYGDILLNACKTAHIPMEEAAPGDAPNKAAVRCLRTNDAAIDPFLLTLANLFDARRNGASIHTRTGVRSIVDGGVILDDGRIQKADLVINATGHECGTLNNSTSMCIQPDKGTILVTERRLFDMVLNRMRPASNGDIIVPSHTTSLIGTTSVSSRSTVPTRDEYRALMREAAALLPENKEVRIIRAFSGVRPLLGSGLLGSGLLGSGLLGGDGRSLSRDYRIEEDKGVITVAGGKLTTYRLIAEKVSDVAMRFLGEKGECRTETPLPNILTGVPDESLLCNCERAASRIVEMDFLEPEDLWKFNRIGFGACQGMRCARNAGRERELLEERWKGIKPVLDDIQMKQSYLSWASCVSQGPFS